MSSQTASLTPKKKLLKGGESRNQEIPVFPIFVGYALVFLQEVLHIRGRMYFQGVTRCSTRQLQ